MKNTRKLIIPALAALALLAQLLVLGLWQLNRRAWKEDIITQVEARANAPPVALKDIPAAWRDRKTVETANFAHITATGAFDHSREFHVIAPQRDGAAWMIVTRFDTTDGSLLVMRGVVPDRVKDPARRADGQVQGEVTIAGRIRLSEQAGFFTPANDVQRNAWFSRDLAGMQRAAGLNETARTPPFFIELETPVPPGGLPRPQLDAINLRNDHMQYAITWFALAGVLVVMFGVWTWGQTRARPDV